MNDETVRRELVLDGENFSSMSEFYDEAERVFTRELPWHPGRNLDAFNDLLRGGFGVHEYGEPITVRWLHSEKSREDLDYTATAAWYAECLERCASASRPRIRHRMEEAMEHRGETLMDMICRIIEDSDDTGHDCVLVLE